jgi:hypothetical protein
MLLDRGCYLKISSYPLQPLFGGKFQNTTKKYFTLPYKRESELVRMYAAVQKLTEGTIMGQPVFICGCQT